MILLILFALLVICMVSLYRIQKERIKLLEEMLDNKKEQLCKCENTLDEVSHMIKNLKQTDIPSDVWKRGLDDNNN